MENPRNSYMLQYGLNTRELVFFATSAKIYTREYKYFHSIYIYISQLMNVGDYDKTYNV